MKLITAEQRRMLVANGRAQAKHGALDPRPVVKLFTPDAQATWLLTELDPEDEDRAFGLCDLGHGFPELGWVSLAELRRVRGPFGLHIERDRGFTGRYPLSVYAEAARRSGRITEQVSELEHATA